VFVPAAVGVTVLDPLRLWLPDQDPLAVQDVALVELQVSVEEVPCMTDVGFALMVTVGAAVVTLRVALLLAVPPAPVQARV
jgi:hypothetical protein